jgi:hypothetical protein
MSAAQPLAYEYGVVSPDIVLIFGAPPKAGINGQVKYAQTRAIIAAKLGDRLIQDWF